MKALYFIALFALATAKEYKKLDNVFSYKIDGKQNHAVANGKERNLILGFSMSEDEKNEERRQEQRKDDVKNLIKVNFVFYTDSLIDLF